MQSNRFSLGLRAALTIFAVVLFATTARAAPQERLLHSFNVDGRDGAFFPSKLTRDSAGNLYGTTTEGGIHFEQCQYGCGTVFELSPQQGGGWTEKILHSFAYSDGAYPGGGVVFDAAGNLYGTTVGVESITPVRYLSCLPSQAEAGPRRCCTTSTSLAPGEPHPSSAT